MPIREVIDDLKKRIEDLEIKVDENNLETSEKIDELKRSAFITLGIIIVVSCSLLTVVFKK